MIKEIDYLPDGELRIINQNQLNSAFIKKGFDLHPKLSGNNFRTRKGGNPFYNVNPNSFVIVFKRIGLKNGFFCLRIIKDKTGTATKARIDKAFQRVPGTCNGNYHNEQGYLSGGSVFELSIELSFLGSSQFWMLRLPHKAHSLASPSSNG